MRVTTVGLMLLLALPACGGGGTSGEAFAPFISGVFPRWISAEGGTEIEIQGNDFTQGQVQVTVDGRAASGLIVDNPRRLRCIAPSRGPGDALVADLRVVSEGTATVAPQALGYIVRLPNPEPAASAAFGGALRTISTGAAPMAVPGRSILVGDFDATAPLDIAVGVPGRAFGGNAGVGEVLVYYGNPDGTFSPPVSIRPETVEGLAFGFSLAAGDIDGDFINDLLIGAPGGSRADVAISNGTARTFQAPLVLDTHPEATSQYGFAVALGQFDGAGNTPREAVVGAPDATAASQPPQTGGAFGGMARVLQGSLVTDVVQGYFPFQNLGTSLITPDYDGDGIDDLIVGSPGTLIVIGGPPARRTGAIDLLRSDGTSGLPGTGYFPTQSASFAFTDANPIANEETGAAMAAGAFDDVSGDDYLVGMPRDFVQGTVRGGSVRLFYSDGNGSVSFGLEIIEPEPEADARFGLALTTGDFDGDGQLDAAIAAPFATVDFRTAAGRVALFLGNRAPQSVAFEATLTEPVPEDSARFGCALASGDFNRDGRDDLVVAGQGSENNLGASGEVFVFFQPASVQGP